MASFSTEESWHELPDKSKLYTKTWRPSPLSRKPKAFVLFVHGFSDHINRFDHFFELLSGGRDIQVTGFDQRGWGRSVTQKSERGLTGPTATVMADITSMLETHPHCLPEAEQLGLPLFLMGHSMGGAEILYFASEQNPDPIRRKVRGYIALAPYLQLAAESEPSRALVMAGRLALRVVPRMQMVQKLRADNLCRDKAVGRSWEEDPLCHNTGTLEGMNGMIDRGEHLVKGIAVLDFNSWTKGGEPGDGSQQPALYVAHGSNDKITNAPASKRFVDEQARCRDKTIQVYEGWYHVLYAEPGEDKTMFANDTADWILSRAAGAHAAPSAPTATAIAAPPAPLPSVAAGTGAAPTARPEQPDSSIPAEPATTNADTESKL